MYDNWKTYKLGDIIVSANTGLDAIKRAPIVQDDTGIKCLRIQDVSQEKEYNNWGFCNVSKENYKKFALKEGEIIIARTGNTIGVNMFVKEDINSVFNNGLIRIRVNKQLNYPKYLYYIFRSNSFKNYIQAIAFGTSTQPNMQIGSLLNYDLVLPPLPEQRAIANILSTIDDKIENNLAMNKTLEDMAMALYKNWFVDFGPFQEGKFVDSELGLIPEGWEVKPIGEFVNHQKGYAFKSKWYKSKGKVVVRVSDTTHNSIDLNSCNRISYQKAEELKKYNLTTNDVIITSVGSWPPNYASVVGKVVRVPSVANGCLLNQNAVKLQMKLKDKKHQSLLYFTLKNVRFLNYIVNTAQGSASQASIKLTDIFDYKIPFLSITNFINFSSQADSLIEQQNQLIEENQTLTQLRDTLLPKLISGEVRLKEFEEVITAAL
ncbi:restriction endonuclease subunit S [Cellulophaga baltica]|uniref:restriction endonuclease subunit S n=1 Tax=Cellulophaga baltica TaxID=76594 RepID=UPI002495200D|nr:restriction endonuclease subunit S [Cellulophaga baltica]